MAFFAHEKAICESTTIGEGTRIWAFAHILPGAVIGKSCNICDGVFIENDVVLGDHCTIKCGVQLWDGIRISDRVFVGPNATFTNDPFPRSNTKPLEFSRTLVQSGVSIGANATILPGVELERNSMVGAGAVVNVSVPAHAIVVGNPCRIVRFTDTEIHHSIAAFDWLDKNSFQLTEGMDVMLYKFPRFEDRRGALTVMDYDSSLPFIPKRTFVVQDVPKGVYRGNHAHKEGHQLLMCLKGSCRLFLDDGAKRVDLLLDSSNIGVYIPPKVWGVQYKFSSDAVLSVMASDHYDQNDYVNSYEEFVAIRESV